MIQLLRQIKGRRGRRGVVLITALFFMMLFAMLSLALYQLTPSDNRTAARDKTMTEAHFACTAGMRDARAWIMAVVAPENNTAKLNHIGQESTAWSTGTVSVGTISYNRVNNDPFSVPDNASQLYRTVALGSLACPHGRFQNPLETGMDYLGLKPGVNLSPTDYDAMKAAQANWLCLRSRNPLVVGDMEVYTYVVPSALTQQMATGGVANGLRSYLVTSIAYRSGQPMLRARCILREKSAADYAYRNNAWGTDSIGNPLAFSVNNANNQLFDGPVHTNAVPFFNVASSYWNEALAYNANNPEGIRAIKGALTFSGTNTSLSPAFDGIGWEGGNFNANSTDKRPYDATGLPIPLPGSFVQPPAPAPTLADRYDRFIQGGRTSIQKIAEVPLPDDLVNLRDAAFGSTGVTGLAVGAVNPTQKAGSLQTVTVPDPPFRQSNGNLVDPVDGQNASEVGMFINTVSSTNEAAGGIAIVGNTRNMFLEVTDSNGRIVTDTTALETGDVENVTIGNPTVRIQTTGTSWDENSTYSQTNYASAGPSQPPAFSNGPTAGYWSTPPVVDPNPYALHGSNCSTSPAFWPSGTSGLGAATYPCVHTTDPPASQPPAVWIPPTTGGWTTPPAVQTFTLAPPVERPVRFRPIDWVTDVKNVDLTIPAPSTATPWRTDNAGASQAGAWRKGVGTNLSDNGNHQVADHLNITKVVVHNGASDTTGTELTTPMSIAKASNKVVLYKQSRSDANRLDVFILDRPSGEPGLNGAVYSTGDIAGLRGVNMDRKTIGVDYAANRGIAIVDNVWQYGTERYPSGQVAPDNSKHGLGLVATQMNVQTRGNGNPGPWTNNNPLVIFATIIAGKSGNTGGLDVSNLDNGSNRGHFTNNNLGGSFSTIGSVVNGTSAANWGHTAFTSSGGGATDLNASQRTIRIIGGLTEQQAKARLVGARGWNQNFVFDRELSYNPPPFFPAASSLVSVSYSQESVRGR